MTKRTRLVLAAGLAGLLLLLIAILVWPSAPAKGGTGGLSSRDLHEIRGVIAADLVPWRFFKLSTIRFWPGLIRKRWTVRIIAVLEDNSSISKTRFEPNGSETKISFPVVIQYSANGRTNLQFLIKKNGRWQTDWMGREFLPSVQPRAAAPLR